VVALLIPRKRRALETPVAETETELVTQLEAA